MEQPGTTPSAPHPSRLPRRAVGRVLTALLVGSWLAMPAMPLLAAMLSWYERVH